MKKNEENNDKNTCQQNRACITRRVSAGLQLHSLFDNASLRRCFCYSGQPNPQASLSKRLWNLSQKPASTKDRKCKIHWPT